MAIEGAAFDTGRVAREIEESGFVEDLPHAGSTEDSQREFQQAVDDLARRFISPDCTSTQIHATSLAERLGAALNDAMAKETGRIKDVIRDGSYGDMTMLLDEWKDLPPEQLRGRLSDLGRGDFEKLCHRASEAPNGVHGSVASELREIFCERYGERYDGQVRKLEERMNAGDLEGALHEHMKMGGLSDRSGAETLAMLKELVRQRRGEDSELFKQIDRFENEGVWVG